MENRITNTLDTITDPAHYIIRKMDGTDFVKVSKARSKKARLINYFNIISIDGKAVTEADLVEEESTEE